MADVTIGFKGSEALREKVKEMVEASGLQSKEWFESVLRLAEVEQLKNGETDFSKDLSELSLHTNRINELITNMVKRAAFEKAEVVKKVEEVKESKDEIIMGYQVENSELNVEIERLKKETEMATQAVEESLEEQNQLRENVENQKALIGEYKEKIDTLSGLLSEYKSAAEENKALLEENRSLQAKLNEQTDLIKKLQSEREEMIIRHKQTLKETEERYSTSLAAANSQAEQNLLELSERNTADTDRMKERHDTELERIQERHTTELERLEERKEMEKERALLALRTEMQNKQQELVEQHVKKIEELYRENRELREKRNK